MDFEQLVTAGLTEQQAKAYALLLERGEVKPTAAAKELGLSRTNAYKVYDRLVELELANKQEIKKLFVYRPNNPLALTNIAANFRAEAVARENAVNNVLNNLLDKFYEHVKQPIVEVGSGRQAVADAYRRQIGLNEEIFFIHSRSDVSLMGFDTMHEIRTSPARRGVNRHAIMGDPGHEKINYESHKRSNLDITWAEKGCYDMPVEWSVTKSSLLIVLFGSEPHAITIMNPLVAGSFLQLWHMMDSLLRQQKTHKHLAKS